MFLILLLRLKVRELGYVWLKAKNVKVCPTLGRTGGTLWSHKTGKGDEARGCAWWCHLMYIYHRLPLVRMTRYWHVARAS